MADARIPYHFVRQMTCFIHVFYELANLKNQEVNEILIEHGVKAWVDDTGPHIGCSFPPNETSDEFVGKFLGDLRKKQDVEKLLLNLEKEVEEKGENN